MDVTIAASSVPFHATLYIAIYSGYKFYHLPGFGFSSICLAARHFHQAQTHTVSIFCNLAWHDGFWYGDDVYYNIIFNHLETCSTSSGQLVTESASMIFLKL